MMINTEICTSLASSTISMNNTTCPSLTKHTAATTASLPPVFATTNSAACGHACHGFAGLGVVGAFSRRRAAECAMSIDSSRPRISPFCFFVPLAFSVLSLFVSRFLVAISNPPSMRQAFPPDDTSPDRRFCAHHLRQTNRKLTLKNYDERRLPLLFRQARIYFLHRCNILRTGYLDNLQSIGVSHFQLDNKEIPTAGDDGSLS